MEEKMGKLLEKEEIDAIFLGINRILLENNDEEEEK